MKIVQLIQFQHMLLGLDSAGNVWRAQVYEGTQGGLGATGSKIVWHAVQVEIA